MGEDASVPKARTRKWIIRLLVLRPVAGMSEVADLGRAVGLRVPREKSKTCEMKDNLTH